MTTPFANQARELQKTINSVTTPFANQARELQKTSVVDNSVNIATLSGTTPSFIEVSTDTKPVHLDVVDAIYNMTEQMNQMNQEIQSVKHAIEERKSDTDPKLLSRPDKILGWVIAIARVIGAVEKITDLIFMLIVLLL